MREHGPVTSADQLGLDGHVCWGFDDEDHFAEAVLEFLTDGQRLGQRLAHVAVEPVEDQRERLAPLEGIEAMIDTGALQLFTLKDLFDVDRPVEADTQLAVFSGATDQALADGYTGLRVAAKATELVAGEEKHAAHVRWECIADRYMAHNPLAALCGYDCQILPPDLLTDLAAVHPACHHPTQVSRFRLYSEPGAVMLEGEVDVFSAEDFDRVLEAAVRDDTEVLDLNGLDFIDHHGLETLIRHVRRRAQGDSEFRVENMPVVMRRLCDVLELDLPDRRGAPHRR